MSRPFIPPMPRLAVDGYWRAHPVRADRLARALAARSGAPAGWTWRLGSGRDDGLAATFRAPPAPFREPAFARGPGACCVCGQPVYRFGWHADLWGCGSQQESRLARRLRDRLGTVERAERFRAHPQAIAGAPLRRKRQAAAQDRGGRPPGAALPGVGRAPRHRLAAAAGLLGRAQSAGDQSRRPRRQMRQRGERPRSARRAEAGIGAEGGSGL